MAQILIIKEIKNYDNNKSKHLRKLEHKVKLVQVIEGVLNSGGGAPN